MNKSCSNSISTRLRKLVTRICGVTSITPRIKELRRLEKQKKLIDLELQTRAFLADYPDNSDALSMLAECLRRMNQLDEALDLALRATTSPGAGWRPHSIAGLILKELMRTDEACHHLRMAAGQAPRKANILRHLTEAVAMVDGIQAAAMEYADRSGGNGRKSHIMVAEIRNIREWAGESGLHVLEAGDTEVIPHQTPVSWGNSPAAEIHRVKCEKPCVAELTRARIFGAAGIVLTHDGTALSETAGHPQFGRFVNLADGGLIVTNAGGQVLLDTRGYETREIEEGILLAGSASNAFGHWLPDFLPRLQFLRQHPDFERLPIIVDEKMPQAHFEHLHRLAGNPLIKLKRGESLICGRLLMASSPSFTPVHLFPNDIPCHEIAGLSPRALRFLRNEPDVCHRDEARTGRWFLGRRGMKWSRLLNEAEIGAELASFGFETIYLENMGMEEQIEVFRRAEWIVAPNGSALLNLVFADPGVKLLVLSQPDFFNWGSFQGPMRALGHDPVWLCGGNVVAAGRKHSDYQVPVRKIREVLQDMGLEGIAPPQS